MRWKSPWLEFGPVGPSSPPVDLEMHHLTLSSPLAVALHPLVLSNHPEQAEPGLVARIVGHLAPGLNSSNQLEAASKVEFVPEPVHQLEPVLHLDQVLQVAAVLHLEPVHLPLPVLQLQIDPKHHFELVHQFGLGTEMAGMVLHCLKAPMVFWTT